MQCGTKNPYRTEKRLNTMIERFENTDITMIRELLADEPDLLIRFQTGQAALDLLYFDAWVQRDEQGEVHGLIFRSYGDFFISGDKEMDLEEAASFLGFMPMLYSLSGNDELLEGLVPMLKRVRSTTVCGVARQEEAPELPVGPVTFCEDVCAEDYRKAYDLIKRAGESELSDFEEYYITRRGLNKKDCGRTYFLGSSDSAYSTVSTTGEGDGMALLTDVVTDENRRRMGHSSALVTQICFDLHAAGLIPHVTYSTSQAEHFFARLGFRPCGQFTYVRFDPLIDFD